MIKTYWGQDNYTLVLMVSADDSNNGLSLYICIYKSIILVYLYL